ncbi:hypothetical protein JOQ06_019080, partial [Pogonophryne albipinna]
MHMRIKQKAKREDRLHTTQAAQEESHFSTRQIFSCTGETESNHYIVDTDTTTKREIALKCLILNIGESVEDLIKEFL